MALLGMIVGLLLGAAAVFFWRRPGPAAGGRLGANPLLLVDPALRWLAEARNALGVWVREASERDPEDGIWHRVTPGGRLSVEAQRTVLDRLRAVSVATGGGTERLEAGVLVHGSTGTIAAGVLLPTDAAVGQLRTAEEDVAALLDGMARRPAFQQAHREANASTESLGSIGLRLAYQMERILNAEVIVAVASQGIVRVIGTSSRADRRLMDGIAQPGSPIHQVATDEVPSLTSIADPLGGLVQDRRAHVTPAIVYPIKSRGAEGETVGAVAFWCDDDGSPIGPVIAEVQEALRNAGPRMEVARTLEEQGSVATTDPLTGLRNRRGLEDAMRRVGIATGTLIYADFDKFKLLNDTLGHPAGDAALVHFARLVHDIIRGADTAARIGGEEFAIWLPGANLAVGAQVAERIRISLGTTTWDWQGRSWPLSASFGVAALPDTTRSIDNLPAQADAALVEAKRAGRDRVHAARQLSPM